MVWLYNKDHGTITMGCHFALKHYVILELYQIWNSNVIIEFDVHQIIKKRRKTIQKKLTLLKNNSLKIWYSTSQTAITHWAPLKTSSWKGLFFICAFGLCLLIEGNSLMKLSQWCSTRPWNDMWFLPLLKHHNYCNFGVMDVLKRHGHLCTCCKLYPQKVGNMSYHGLDLWGSWNIKHHHGCAIESLACLVWIVGQCHNICWKWRCQFEHLHYNLNKHCVLCFTTIVITLCCHLLWACHVKMLSICY
jgi:hypothetical protein